MKPEKPAVITHKDSTKPSVIAQLFDVHNSATATETTYQLIHTHADYKTE